MVGFTYKSYSFIDKDPLIDEIRTVFEASGATYKWVHDESGVTRNTISNWFDGKTKRPQAATVNAVLRALGYKLAIVHDHNVTITETPRKPRDSTRHVVQMHKYRRRKNG